MYKYKLERYTTHRSRFTCPSCNKRGEFTRYIDVESNEYLGEEVGKCNRENHCGYHYTPKEYFKDKGLVYDFQTVVTKQVLPDEKPLDYIDLYYLEKSLHDYTASTFGQYIKALFGPEIAKEVLFKYLVGRSKIDNGKASIFWRADIDQNIRTGKIMCYNKNGKRDKTKTPSWVHSCFQPFNYHLCFFGEHLLSVYPDKTVAIVESEKTAIIASIYLPEFVWIATGGKTGCKWREYSVFKALKGRNVILFPDYGWYNKNASKTCFQEWFERGQEIMGRISCSITVNDLLEKNLKQEEREKDYDLVDFLIKQDEQTGHAITDYGYPFFWDINIKNII